MLRRPAVRPSDTIASSVAERELRRRGRLLAGALVALGPLEQRLEREHGVVDPACRSPSLAKRSGHGRDRAVPRARRRRSRPTRSASRRSPSRQPAHRVRAGDRVVAGVLVVVDEHLVGLAVLAPPGRRRVARRRAARPRARTQARHGARRRTPSGARSARRRGCPTRRRSSASRPRRARRAPRGRRARPGGRVSNRQSGIGSRSIRHSSGRSTSARREFHGMELDGRHLHRPDHVGELGHAQLVGVPARREVDPHGLAPTAARPTAAASGGPCRRRRRGGSGAACTAARAARGRCRRRPRGSSARDRASSRRARRSTRAPGSRSGPRGRPPRGRPTRCDQRSPRGLHFGCVGHQPQRPVGGRFLITVGARTRRSR